jgi:predicted N-acetyltransferase YhbS
VRRDQGGRREGPPPDARHLGCERRRGRGRPRREVRLTRDVAITVVEEASLGDAELARIGAFIAPLYEGKGEVYRAAGRRLLTPTLRALAMRDGELVGCYAAFAPRTDPDYGLVGLGDMAVAVATRRLGIGRAMGDALIGACWERGAPALLTASTAMARPLDDLGFHPVTDFSYFWEADGACHRHPYWWARERAGVPARVQLLDPDF